MYQKEIFIMIDLSVKLAGLSLKNPIVVASDDIGCHLGQKKEFECFGVTAGHGKSGS